MRARDPPSLRRATERSWLRRSRPCWMRLEWLYLWRPPETRASRGPIRPAVHVAAYGNRARRVRDIDGGTLRTWPTIPRGGPHRAKRYRLENARVHHPARGTSLLRASHTDAWSSGFLPRPAVRRAPHWCPVYVGPRRQCEYQQ